MTDMILKDARACDGCDDALSLNFFRIKFDIMVVENPQVLADFATRSRSLVDSVDPEERTQGMVELGEMAVGRFATQTDTIDLILCASCCAHTGKLQSALDSRLKAREAEAGS